MRRDLDLNLVHRHSSRTGLVEPPVQVSRGDYYCGSMLLNEPDDIYEQFKGSYDIPALQIPVQES